MKKLVKIVAVLTVFSSLGLIGMGVTSTAASSAASTATSTAATGMRSAGSGLGAHARDLQRSNRERTSLSRDRNRTPEQQERLDNLNQQRRQNIDALRQGGVRNLNRAL